MAAFRSATEKRCFMFRGKPSTRKLNAQTDAKACPLWTPHEEIGPPPKQEYPSNPIPLDEEAL
jgi:hypothetical protein